jgi:hypothetical protein
VLFIYRHQVRSQGRRLVVNRSARLICAIEILIDEVEFIFKNCGRPEAFVARRSRNALLLQAGRDRIKAVLTSRENRFQLGRKGLFRQRQRAGKALPD